MWQLDDAQRSGRDQYLQKVQRQRNLRGLPSDSPVRPQKQWSRGAIQSSASQVLNPGYSRNAAQFYGVTPSQSQKDAAYEANALAFYGSDVEPQTAPQPRDAEWREFYQGAANVPVSKSVQLVPAGKKVLKEPPLTLAMEVQQANALQPKLRKLPNDSPAPQPTTGHYDGLGAEEEEWQKNVQNFFGVDDTPAQKAKQVVTGTAAGKQVLKDAPWSPVEAYSGLYGSPSRKPQTMTPEMMEEPAGVKIPRDEGWIPAKDYSPEMYRREEARSGKIMGTPAGRKIAKEPPWKPAEGYIPSAEHTMSSYRRNEFAAYSPALKSGEARFQQTAGKRIPRDPAFTLAYNPPQSSDPHFAANERRFWGDSQPHGYRSLTPQPFSYPKR